MNKWFVCLLLTFIAYVKTPLGQDKRYVCSEMRVPSWGNGQIYELTLESGKKVYAPVIFTVIEER